MSSWSILCEILRYTDTILLDTVEILAQSFPVSMVHVWFMSGFILRRSVGNTSLFDTLRSSDTESAVPPLIDARP